MKPAKQFPFIALCLSALLCASTSVLLAQDGTVTPEIINSLSAPAKTDTGIGTLEFKDGVPTAVQPGPPTPPPLSASAPAGAAAKKK